MLSAILLLGVSINYGQTEKPTPPADRNLPTNASPMRTGVKRILTVAELKADKVEDCKKLFAAVPAGVVSLLKAAHLRNMTTYLKEIGGKHYMLTYVEYTGSDFPRDMLALSRAEPFKSWQESFNASVAAIYPGKRMSGDLEEVFFTEGAAEVVPTPEKYARIGMITGLKPEKEAEYRTLHATTWPGVLEGIKDCNDRDFSIHLIELDGKLYLIGYLEYVGSDPDADAAKGKALPVNKRWWKFTDACQQPLPAASAKGEIWDSMTEIYHLD